MDIDIDYYYILGLKRTCSKFDILNAFWKFVNEFGMKKLNDTDTKRRLIAFEAYDVLSNPFWRELYDQFGDLQIKLGIYVENEQEIKRYLYHGDIFLTYKSVYGSTNPYTHIITMLINVKANPNNIKQHIQKIPIYLTLNETFFGTLKKINVSKKDGSHYIVNLKIIKGLPVNSEIHYNFSDKETIIFVTYDLPHKHFTRNGYDLISTRNVSMKEMLFGVQYVIKTLDHKQLRVNITQVITPTYQKIIRGEGMPVYGNNCDKRGNIVLRFIIKIPRYIPILNKEFCKTLSEANTIL